MFDIEFTNNASKAIRKLPKKEFAAIYAKLEQVAASPYASHGFVKKMTNSECYRLRAGNYRAIYFIHDDRLVVEVVKISHRKDVYQ